MSDCTSTKRVSLFYKVKKISLIAGNVFPFNAQFRQTDYYKMSSHQMKKTCHVNDFISSICCMCSLKFKFNKDSLVPMCFKVF